MVLFPLVSLLLLSACSAQYLDSCSSSNDCDQSAQLACRDGQCICDYDDCAWDDQMNRCAVNRVRSSCESRLDRVCSQSSHLACDKDSYCRCKSGTEPDDEERCVAQYNEACSPDGNGEAPCKTGMHFQCQNGTCSCGDGLTWEEGYYRNECMAAHGQKCSSDGDSEPRCSSAAGLECFDETCQCGYYKEWDDDEKICKGVHIYATCSSDRECQRSGKQLECQSGSCECVPGSEWSWTEDRCVADLDQSCSYDGVDAPTCRDNVHLYCDGDTQLCDCSDGTWSFNDRACVAQVNEWCSPNGEEEPACDSSGGLQCIDETCSCPAGTEWDDNWSQCFGEIHWDCSGEQSIPCDSLKHLFCARNATCQCELGSTWDLEDRSCYADFDLTCSEDGVNFPRCSSRQNYVCKDDKCKCGDGTRYRKFLGSETKCERIKKESS